MPSLPAYTGSEVIPGITKPKHFTPRITVRAPPTPLPIMAAISGVRLTTWTVNSAGSEMPRNAEKLVLMAAARILESFIRSAAPMAAPDSAILWQKETGSR